MLCSNVESKHQKETQGQVCAFWLDRGDGNG